MKISMKASLANLGRALACAACLVLTGASSIGCATRFIPNTDVEDTSEHRRVVAFCEAYRKAVERKDVPTLLGMASPGYYEEGPNADASDDVDYAGLKQYLSSKFEGANNIRYEIRYRRITLEKRQCLKPAAKCDRVLVDYTYSGSYRLGTKDGEKWKSAVEENRLELVPQGETFLIVTGM
jgi:hypothetical protein